MKREDDPASDRNSLAALTRYSEIGFIIPAAVLLGFGLGKLIDYWLGTHWVYVVGLIFGAAVGFAEMIRVALQTTKEKP